VPRSLVVDHLPLLPFEEVARILFPVHLIHDHLSQNAGAHYFTRNRTRGSDFPPFSPRIGSPNHRSLLLSYAFLAAGKACSSSLDGYDFS
jgi:hypothetical protein